MARDRHSRPLCLSRCSWTNLWFITAAAPSPTNTRDQVFSHQCGPVNDSSPWMVWEFTWLTLGLAQEMCVWDFFYLGPVKVLELFVHQDLGVNRTGQSCSEVRPGCCSCWRGTILTANSITGSNSVGIDRYTIHAACWASQCGCCTETEKQATKKLQAKLQSIMNEFTCVPQQPGHGKNGRSNFMLDVEIFRCRATTFSTLLIIVSFF
jgi:hypothetical protein